MVCSACDFSTCGSSPFAILAATDVYKRQMRSSSASASFFDLIGLSHTAELPRHIVYSPVCPIKLMLLMNCVYAKYMDEYLKSVSETKE